MTDDEIKAELRMLALSLKGSISALTNVIHAMQAQPGYDHEAFKIVLAAFQVADETREKKAPEVFRKAYQKTLADFDVKPIPVPPKPRNRWPSPKG